MSRTGDFVDDYLEYSRFLPAELQRHLSTMRELDKRADDMISQSREMTEACLNMPTQNSKSTTTEQETMVEAIRKEIEVNQESTIALCTEKVLLAQQASDLIDQHMKRLDEDLRTFADDLKQEGRIAQNEPAILPPLKKRSKKKRSHFRVTPVKRVPPAPEKEREPEQEGVRTIKYDYDIESGCERNSDLIPPIESAQEEDSAATGNESWRASASK